MSSEIARDLQSTNVRILEENIRQLSRDVEDYELIMEDLAKGSEEYRDMLPYRRRAENNLKLFIERSDELTGIVEDNFYDIQGALYAREQYEDRIGLYKANMAGLIEERDQRIAKIKADTIEMIELYFGENKEDYRNTVIQQFNEQATAYTQRFEEEIQPMKQLIAQDQQRLEEIDEEIIVEPPDVEIRIESENLRIENTLFEIEYSVDANSLVEFVAGIYKARDEIIEKNDILLLSVIILYQNTQSNINFEHRTLHLMQRKLGDAEKKFVVTDQHELLKLLHGMYSLVEGNNFMSDEAYLAFEGVLDYSWFKMVYVKANPKVLRAGGRSRTLRIEINGMILESPASRGDNCVLAILKKETRRDRWSYTRIRNYYELGDGPIDVGDEINLRNLAQCFRVNIILENTGFLATPMQNGDYHTIRLYVHDNHCYKVTKMSDGEVAPEVEPIRKHFVYYDIEAVADYRSHEYRAFSVSWCYKPSAEADNQVYYEDGWDCIKKFIRFLYTVGTNKDKVFIIGFNSSGFDDYILLNNLLSLDRMVQVYTFKNRVFLTWKRFRTKDLFKYINPMSLADFCKRYKIQNAKTGHESFTFEELNLRYNNTTGTEFIDWVRENIREELEHYNTFDVLAVQEGFMLLRGIFLKFGIELEKYITLGQAVMDVLKNVWEEDNHEKSEYATNYPDLEEYYSIRSAQIAGISYGNRRINLHLYHMLLDVVSLYPYVMGHLDLQYPIGDYIRVSRYTPGDLGIFRCTNINQLALGNSLNIIPNKITRSNSTVYSWTDRTLIAERMLCTADIEQLMKYGCSATVHEGFVWRHSLSGREIYGKYIDQFAAIKAEEDENKINNPELYNQGRRETAKMCINTPTGKIAQIYKYFTEHKVIFENQSDVLQKFINTHEKVCITTRDKFIFVSGEVPEDPDACPQGSLQAHSVFLYAYARKHMYDHLIYEREPLVIETDSSLIHKNEIDILNTRMIRSMTGEIVPLVWDGVSQKYFGQLENEIDNIQLVVSPGKKTYYLEYLNRDPISEAYTTITKRRFKGVSRRWVEAPENLINRTHDEQFYIECEEYYRDHKIVLNDYGEFDLGCDQNSCLKYQNYYRLLDEENAQVNVLQRLITRVYHKGTPIHNLNGRYKTRCVSLRLEYRIKKLRLH